MTDEFRGCEVTFLPDEISFEDVKRPPKDPDDSPGPTVVTLRVSATPYDCD